MTFLSFALIPIGFCQTIKGYIKDTKTGETLSGVIIRDSAMVLGAVSNQYGFFSLKVKLPCKLRISSMGYQSILFEVQNTIDSIITIDIQSVAYNLGEVVIRQSKTDFQNREVGFLSIPVERLSAIPAIFGEKDIFKALALTPGVSTGNEGTTGLHIRGGTPDQNLILLDEAPIYNTSHFFGLMSVFNSEALKKVDLYRGFIPAHYGGRISSVMDITMKEGNIKHRRKSYGIGLISSNGLWEGYLSNKNREKGSFMISGRTAYAGLLTIPLWLAYQGGKTNDFYTYLMYDINAKLNYKIDNKSHIYLSIYNSYDIYNVQQRYSPTNKTSFKVDWGNLTGTLRYNRVLRSDLFFKSVLLFTRYKYSVGFNDFEKISDAFKTTNSYFLTPSLFDITNKNTIEYFPNNNHTIRAGIETTKHFYTPTQIKTTLPLSRQTVQASNLSSNALEMSVFAEDEFGISHFLKISVGVRVTNFLTQDKSYQSVEPRLASNITLPKDWQLKMGYSQGKQFIHLLTTNSIGLPNDIWVPTTKNVSPQFARQFSVGIFKNYPSSNVTVSVEGYYKALNNLIDYKTGTSLVANLGKTWESLIEKNGIGKGYGVEFFLQKSEGRFTGWLAYTLAWNRHQFLNINNGEWFNSNFDRRHTLNLVGNWKLSPAINLASNWTFNTGRPITVPIASYQTQQNNLLEFVYGNRNNYRLPNYHRMDLALNWDRQSKKRQRTNTWSVGAYNIYNRQNPYYLKIQSFAKLDPSTNEFDFSNVSSSLYSFGIIPIIPYVSYSAKI